MLKIYFKEINLNSFENLNLIKCHISKGNIFYYVKCYISQEYIKTNSKFIEKHFKNL